MIQLPAGLSFPDDNIPEKEKLKDEFGKNVGRAFYSRYCANSTYYGYGSQAILNEIRNYGNGDQDNGKYINSFTNGSPIGTKRGSRNNSSNSGTGGPNMTDMSATQRVGLANISYDVYSPMAKLSNILLAMMSENDYKVDCVSLDKAVTDAKMYKKAEIMVKSHIMNPMAKRLGLQPMKVPFVPRDEAQIEMMDKLGFFKSQRETALE